MPRRPRQDRIPSTFTGREREILRARERGETYAALAARFGVNRSRIEQIAADAAKRMARLEAAKEGLRGDPRNTPVQLLPLSSRIINAVLKHGVKTLRDLERCSDSDIVAMKNLGQASLREIRAVVRRCRGGSLDTPEP